MRKIGMLIMMVFMGILVFSQTASAENSVGRPTIYLSHKGGKVAPGAPINVQAFYDRESSKVNRIIYSVNNGKRISTPGNETTIFTPDKIGSTFSVYVRAECDSPKTWAWKIVYFEVVEDTIPPEFYLHSSPGMLYASDEILVSVYDNLSAVCHVTYWWDDRKPIDDDLTLYEDLISVMAGDALSPSSSSPKTHTLHIYVKDEAGNLSPQGNYSYKINPNMR